MRYLHMGQEPRSEYPVCFLVPVIQKSEIRDAYLTPFDLDPEDILVYDLYFDPDKKKTPKGQLAAYCETLVPTLNDLGVQYIVVTDSDYFKVLTGKAKTEAYLGYVLPCKYGPQHVVYVPNYAQIFFDPPKIKAKIKQGMEAIISHAQGMYTDPGNTLIKHEAYPKDIFEIQHWLNKLLAMDCDLTIDIETFSLKHPTAGIGTIAFAWNKHEGVAFPVDYVPLLDEGNGIHGFQGNGLLVRRMLLNFFKEFKHKAIYHNIAFDAYDLIYQLFMQDILDTDGLLRGMDVMLRNWDCTKLISYLATNSCAGNKLGLKDQSQEFAGNYAVDDIKDICKIPLDKLLRYNLVDCLSTWYVYEKNHPRMVQDQQLDVYEKVFKPATLDIIQMQLTGLPVNMAKVVEAKAKFIIEQDKALAAIKASPLVERFMYGQHEQWAVEKNLVLKKKRVTAADSPLVFNPNSGNQVQAILYEMLALPVLQKTDTGQPSTKAEHLEDLKNHTTNPEVLALIQGLLDYAAVQNFLSTFIPAFEGAVEGPDGWHYLFGNFNLGGTLSGRLSSSNPNLQNLPAAGDMSKKKGTYGKWIKECVQAPPGWVFAGLDFASLEDRISALTTRDPEKLKVYTDGYDGHSLRAYAYYKEQMEGIDPNSVQSINSISKKYPNLRYKSKNPTFTLTYQGTWNTLVTKYKFDPELAKLVEARYHDLYRVSDEWVAAKLDEAAKVGYVTVAFGLRVRTPLLHQVIRGNSKTPYEAEAEGRSAGNALGQSWCLLNSRAASEFMGKVRASDFRLAILPCAQIHDAQYYRIREDMDVVLYMNDHLVEAVKWQDHPDIWHPEVGLGGEVSLFYPNWAKEIVIPNGATDEEIKAAIEKGMN